MTSPDDKTLRRYLLGQLTIEESAIVKAFIETAPEAKAILERLTAVDSFTEPLRGSQAAQPLPQEVHLLAGRVEKLTLTAGTGDADRTRTIGDASVESSQDQALTKTSEDWDSFLTPPSAAGELGRLGDYRILRILGVGGMGIVFEAEDVKLGRRVAVKAMKPSVAESPTAKARFLREAKAAAAVEHDHVIPIHLIGEANGVPFLVMPYLKGESLDDRVKRERILPVAEVVRIGREVAEGLSAAHAQGLIHRDIKPANLWLEEPGGRVKILDFGLARGVQTEGGPSSEITQSGVVIGTPAYMSPEQGRGQTLDVRSDLFSLGGVLYRIATGRQPFTGEDSASVLMALAADDPAHPRTLNPALPVGLSSLIQNLLEKDPTKRPQSARDVANLLLPAIESDAVVQPVGKRKSHRGWKIACAVAVLLIGVGLFWSPTIVRVATNKGELVVQVDDPTIEVIVKDGKAEVHDKSKNRRFILKAGEGEIEFLDPETGATAVTKSFKIERGGKAIVEATMADVLAARKSQHELLPESPADEQAPKDYFPGNPVVYETFDDPKTCSMFQGTFEGVKFEVAKGRYVVTSRDSSKNSEAKLAPKLNDYAFATRVRSDSGISVELRRRALGTTTACVRLYLHRDGNWELSKNSAGSELSADSKISSVTVGTASLVTGKFPDSEVAVGRWISLAGRNVGDVCEIWLNGRLAARVNDPISSDFPLAKNCLTIEARATAERPSRLEIDHVAVWDLKAASTRVDLLGDKPPEKDLFPGKLLTYETFDDPKACTIPSIQTAEKHARCENGVFTAELHKAKQEDFEGYEFGTATRDSAVAARFRVTNGVVALTFRRRLTEKRSSSLQLSIGRDGWWTLQRVNLEWANNNWRFLQPTLLHQDTDPNPELAEGKWIALRIKSIGPITEIWAGSKMYTRIVERDVPDDLLPLDPKAIFLGNTVAVEGPAKLEIDYAAVWNLSAEGMLEPPVAEPSPAKNLYPGQLVAYETFDDPKTCPFPTIQSATKHSRCENGVYIEDFPKAKQDEVQAHRLGASLRDLAVATRFRVKNGHARVSFRHRISATRMTYLLFDVGQDGSWTVYRVSYTPAEKEWKIAEQKLLAQDLAANPELAEGKWISLKLRSIGPITEISAGLKMTARVAEREDNDDLLPLDADTGIQIGMVAFDGPTRFELDYAAVWKLTPIASKLTPEEQELFSQINKERAAGKLPLLAPNERIIEAARKHAYQMAAWGKLSHESEDKTMPERLKDAGYAYSRMGENVAFVIKNVAEAMETWKQGAAHRDNLLSPNFLDVGIGIARSAKGDIYVSAMFAAPLASKLVADPESLAAEWVRKYQGTIGLADDGPAIHAKRIDLPTGAKIKDADLGILSPLSRLNVLVLSGTSIGDEGMEHLAKIFTLAELHLAETKVGDEGVMKLKSLQELRLLTLSGTPMTNRSASVLANLPKLENLNLNATGLSDDGVIELAKSPSLKELFLSNTAVSDKGLVAVASLKTLRTLNLSDTKVSAEGVKNLHEALPECKIEWGGKFFGPVKK